MDVLLEDLLDADPAPPSRRRTALLAVAGVATAGALGAGGWYGTGWLRDGDLRAALATSTSAVQTVTERAARVQSAADLVLLSSEADLAVSRVERARARLRGDSPATAELDAQRDVLAALVPLASLGAGPLQAWGRVRDPLEEALLAEAGTRAALRRERPAAAARAAAAVQPLGPAVDRAAAPVLTRACGTELARVRAVLAGARTTADVRAAGEVGRTQQAAVARSARAPGGGALQRCAAVVGAVAGLAEVTGAAPDAWAPARVALEPVLGGTDALLHVDAVVSTAVGAQRDYEAGLVAADAARRADAEALAQHTAAVRGLTAGYGALDAALTALLDSLVARRAEPADLAAFAADVAARQRTAAGLTGLVAPPLLATEHAALVQAATVEAAAVQAVADALAAQAGLPLLPAVPEVAGVVRGLPLGQLVGQRVGAAAARAAAAAAWDTAAVRATALVDKRPVPAPPVA